MAKSENQKLKIFYIADYLMKKTDADIDGNIINGVLMYEIKDYLKSKGIVAEEHSISRDIELLRTVRKIPNGDKEYILDIAGGRGKPLYLSSRKFDFEDLETIAECISSAKFISKNEAEDLIDSLKILCSEYQAKSLKSDNFVAERPKYTQKKMLNTLRVIKRAIRDDEKINFFYTRHSPNDFSKIENRRKGKRYVVSPFKIVLSDGNHYLIGYDETYHQIKPYRIDRMDDIKVSSEPRDGIEKFKRMGISDYAKQTFGMFIGGKADRITICFENSLLDAMLERFPRGGGTEYTKIDDKHFTVRTFIVESENFYGWVCGLGEKAIITDPPETVERFKSYLQKITERYN